MQMAVTKMFIKYWGVSVEVITRTIVTFVGSVAVDGACHLQEPCQQDRKKSLAELSEIFLWTLELPHELDLALAPQPHPFLLVTPKNEDGKRNLSLVR